MSSEMMNATQTGSSGPILSAFGDSIQGLLDDSAGLSSALSFADGEGASPARADAIKGYAAQVAVAIKALQDALSAIPAA